MVDNQGKQDVHYDNQGERNGNDVVRDGQFSEEPGYRHHDEGVENIRPESVTYGDGSFPFTSSRQTDGDFRQTGSNRYGGKRDHLWSNVERSTNLGDRIDHTRRGEAYNGTTSKQPRVILPTGRMPLLFISAFLFL